VYSNVRVAYLLDWKFSPASGVGKKIVDQIESWNRFGLEVTLFINCPAEQEDEWAKLSFHVRTYTYTSYRSRLNARKESLQQIIDERFEIIYTRFGILSPFTIRKMKKIPTILELNTKGLLEYKRRSLLLYFYACVTSKIILNNAVAVCAITSEVANEATRIAGNEINYKVFPNSINLKRFTIFLPQKNERPKLVFVGTPGLVWHGIDRLIELARSLFEFDFYIIGPKQILDRPSNVKFIGELYDDDLNNFLSSMDIAISSLALDRNQMTEGSPIKTRLYLALGLPVIIGYTDAGIGSSSKYIFKIAPNEWPLNQERVDDLRNFVKKFKGRRVSHKDLFSIDSDSIEKMRADFIIETAHAKRIFSR